MDLLNKEEVNELERCEVVIRQGLQTFIEVGQALLTIRDKRLYRSEFKTFEEYCNERWAMSKAYTYRMISAAETIYNLSPIGDILPSTESQARSLTKLEPEVQIEAWSEVVAQHGQDITAPKVQAIADQFIEVNDQIKQAKKEPLFTADSPEELLRKAKEVARQRAEKKEAERIRRQSEFEQMPTFDRKVFAKCFIGDCVQGMKSKELKKCDLLLSDPPYGMEFRSNYNILQKDKIDNDKLYETIDVLNSCFFEAKKHLKPDAHVYIFGNIMYMDSIKPIFCKYFHLKNIIIWDREIIGMGDLKTYGKSYDVIYFGYNEEWKDLNGTRDRDVLRFARVSPPNLKHPTEKPQDLLSYIIKKSTKENDYILDPFAGSCSTLQSAYDLNRNSYGFELQNKYVPSWML